MAAGARPRFVIRRGRTIDVGRFWQQLRTPRRIEIQSSWAYIRYCEWNFAAVAAFRSNHTYCRLGRGWQSRFKGTQTSTKVTTGDMVGRMGDASSVSTLATSYKLFGTFSKERLPCTNIIEQEALLLRRDYATCLSVEILQQRHS